MLLITPLYCFPSSVQVHYIERLWSNYVDFIESEFFYNNRKQKLNIHLTSAFYHIYALILQKLI